MRISDWSSDVCSSDLGTTAPGIARPLRIAMVSRTLDGEAPHPDVALALRRAADLCHGLGHGVEPVEAIVDGGAVARAFRTIWGYLAREAAASVRSEAHTSELQSLMRISYAVFCLKKKKT